MDKLQRQEEKWFAVRTFTKEFLLTNESSRSLQVRTADMVQQTKILLPNVTAPYIFVFHSCATLNVASIKEVGGYPTAQKVPSAHRRSNTLQPKQDIIMLAAT